MQIDELLVLATKANAALAETSKVCLPFLTWNVWPEVQGWQPGGIEANSKLACFFFVFALGPLVICVSGGVEPGPLPARVPLPGPGSGPWCRPQS
jgi:hypothetical protein